MQKLPFIMLFQRCGRTMFSLFLIGLLLGSFFYTLKPFFQKQQQLQTTAAYAQNHIIFHGSNQSSANKLSNALLETFKTKVFKQLSGNSSNHASFSNSGIPVSIVVGTVTPNGTQASGYGNVSSSINKKVDGNTVFDIASIEKTFVTTVLADMVKQGLVNLDDPVEKYLPSNNVTVPTYNGHKITLKDLATHTSGLPDFPAGWVRNHTYTTQQVYNFLSTTSLSSQPGLKADYSDVGMGLLGHILSLRAGVSFDQLVKDRILDVLDMKSTGTGMNATGISVPEDIKSRFAKGHIDGKEVNLEFIPEAIQSAGALYSTANDMLKYLSANMGLIHTEINDAMQQTHLIRHSFGAPYEGKSLMQDYIGLGWTVTTDFGNEVIWHTGSIDGYTSIIGFNDEKQIGLVILCSSDIRDLSPKEMIDLMVPFLLHYNEPT
jgi:D-alanyl-D-alanine-carboxypeptidase/D-alanyl-D-alanine-endopeptidase